MSKVQDMMTRNPVTCFESDLVFTAVEMMKRQKVGAIPIVDHNYVCKGMVTDRDIVLEVIYNQRDPRTTLLRDIMSQHLITCLMDEDLDETIRHMRSRRVKRIVVLDQNSHCVGLLSEADIIKKSELQKPREHSSFSESNRGIYGGAR